MKNKLAIILIAFAFFSCKDKLDDKSKRNENWAWWVDAKTGKAGWVPVNKGKPVKDERYTLFYFNGNIFKKGRLVEGIDADTIFYFDLNGNLLHYDISRHDTLLSYYMKDGFTKTFHQDGRISMSGIIENHKIGSKCTSYYESGRISYIKNLTRDTGWETDYYENGKVKDSIYNVGIDNSFEIKSWFANWQIKNSDEFRNGNLNGFHKRYFSNGQLADLSQIINGKRSGELKFWYEDGHLNGIEHFTDDVLNGRQVQYFENGKIQAEVNEINGKPDGECKQYDETGRLIKDKIFKDGVVIEDKMNTFPFHRN